MSSRKLRELALSSCEQQATINEVRKLIGPVAEKFPTLCSDASIIRFLKARNWNTRQASKMLKETMKWKLEYKPEKIRWEHIAREAEAGQVYRANILDKYGRTVLIMRPGCQYTGSTEGQIRYFIYCMENAILNLKQGQEQMVWLIDFQGWSMSSISLKVTRETAHVLQDRYPERLAVAILYNPPKLFESFWLMVKPFLDRKTYRKVKFVYSDDPLKKKIIEDLFDLEQLDSAFGGKNAGGFDYEAYAKRMEEEDKKMAEFIRTGNPLMSDQASISPEMLKSVSESESCDESGYSSSEETNSNLDVCCIAKNNLKLV